MIRRNGKARGILRLVRRRNNFPEGLAGEIWVDDIVSLQERRQGQPGI